VTFDLHGPLKSIGCVNKVYPAGITIIARLGQEQALSHTFLEA